MPLNMGYPTKTPLWHQKWTTIPCIHPAKGEVQTTHTTINFIWGIIYTHRQVHYWVWSPQVWAMEGIYKITKEPHWYLETINIIELDDFIQEFDS